MIPTTLLILALYACCGLLVTVWIYCFATDTDCDGFNDAGDGAPSTAKPVFRGIAALSDAINKATGPCD